MPDQARNRARNTTIISFVGLILVTILIRYIDLFESAKEFATIVWLTLAALTAVGGLSWLTHAINPIIERKFRELQKNKTP